MKSEPAANIAADPLEEDEVQVWRLELPDEPVAEEAYLRTLCSDERERAGRLRAGQVRMQFLVGRNLVRYLVGREMGIRAEEVRLITGEYGKPEVVPVDGRSVSFNVAHSRATVLVAMCRGGAVGVDVEFTDRQTDVTEVAKHAMTESEQWKLLSLEDMEDRRRAFFRSWTRKEAIVKADGRGLSLPLASFEVSMEEQLELSSAIAVPALGSTAAASYYVRDVDAVPGMYAAIATSFPAKILQSHDLGKAGLSPWK